MAEYNTGVLHTDSKYNRDFQEAVLTEKQEITLTELRDQEKKLYTEFKCDNYEDFLNKIHGLFDPANIKVLQRYQPDELNKSLEQFRSGRKELYNQEVIFIFDTSKIDNNIVTDIFNEYVKDSKVGKIEIGLTYNSSSVKKIFNNLFKNQYFLTKSESMEIVERAITLLIANGSLEIVTQNPKTGEFTEKFEYSIIPNFPWGVTKELYEEAKKKNNQTVLDEFNRAGKVIKNFVCDELSSGATESLKSAIETAWEKKFSKAEEEVPLFFQGTREGNFISAVQGALGEFQAAIIFTFLEQQLGSKSPYTAILGDKLSEGEQLKTDLSIIQGLGLQVKNVTAITNKLSGKKQLLRDLETNIHPQKFSEYLDGGVATNFLDYISNYFFNTSFAENTKGIYNKLITSLGKYLGEIMNLAVGDVTDTVCFYLIGGKYLVPASKILEASKELDLANSISITSSYNGLSDDEYKSSKGKSTKSNEQSPLYTEFWISSNANQSSWTPTEKNYQVYNRLITHDISIRTHFNLLQEIESYALF